MQAELLIVMIVVCLVVMRIAFAYRKKIFHDFAITNRWTGEVLCSGFSSREDANRYLACHFVDEISLMSVVNDFVIMDLNAKHPELSEESFLLTPSEEDEECDDSGYLPQTPYWKNRISKYYEKRRK